MVEVIERETVGETIDATVNYILNNGEKLFTQTAGPGATDVRTGGTVDPRRVPIHNARLHAEPFALDREGFRFVRHDTKVADFFDEDEVRRVYYPEMEALVKAESGASRVVVFDHTLRTADDEQREARKIREVVRRVHNDYTEWSGPQRVRDLLPDEADDLLQRRFAIVQVWRPIRHPVESFPLAICDARSISPDDFVVNERRYPNRIGQTYAITYNPEHRWYWLPRMRREEALVFKVYDFAEGWPRALVCPYRLRRPDLAAERAAAREHRNPHPGLFLRPSAAPARSRTRPECAQPRRKGGDAQARRGGLTICRGPIIDPMRRRRGMMACSSGRI